jgi:signal transduction histidine kinase
MNYAQEQPIAVTLPNRVWRLRLARAGWVLITVFITAVFIASAPTATINQRQDWQFAEALPAVWPYMSSFTFAAVLVGLRFASLVAFYAVALLIARRKWNDWFALFVSASLLMVAFVFVGRSDTTSYVYPTWMGSITPTLNVSLTVIFIFSWFLLFYLLPDGRFVPRWSAWLVLLPIPGLFLLSASENFRRLIPPQLRATIDNLVWGALMVSVIITVLAGLFAQFYRYRRVATPTQRQQMKWILVGLAVQPLFIMVSLFGLGLPMGPHWSELISILFGLFAITLLPVTIGLAVFRRRLWDVDPLINRTLVYGGLTLLVLVVYITFVGLAFVLFGEASNLFLAALTVGVAALLAQPIRAWLQRAVNRLMYGDRDDPATVLTHLSDRLATATAPDQTLSLLVETIGHALRLPYAAVEVAGDGGPALVAEAGQAQPNPLRFPLVYQTAPVGVLIVAPRSADESFTLAERRLLDNIAQQAGAAVYAAQLTGHLQRSREQLVLAREEERRRLQRDLHDGLGPQLAALGMQLDVARGLAAGSPEAAALIGRLSAETQTAIADIRRLVYDLRPPALDQLGLVGAVREYVAGQSNGSGPRLTVDAPETLPPLPAAIEVAAYRIVQEAVANCLRHAAAETCRITLSINRALHVEITDDGRGLPPAVGGQESASGVGLASMRERAAELGGECRVESVPGHGTQVVATFPLPEEPRP